MAENHNNYGDVALNLSPDWDRGSVGGDPNFALTTVGHSHGVADAYLTQYPSQLHQFRWVQPQDNNAVSVLRSNHYVFCTRKEWTKNDALWEWDGEGYILHNGCRLMARTKNWYDRDQQLLDQRTKDQNRRSERGGFEGEDREVRQLEARGAIVTDEGGRQLKPLSPQKQK